MSWPPETLTNCNIEDLINECELAELLPTRAQGKEFIPVVELAALLYSGEYVHARHLWRRYKENNNAPNYMQDWWNVGAAMLCSDPEMIWKSIAHIQTNHPAPFPTYAVEVGIQYRKRILSKFGVEAACKSPYLELLNFASAEEMQQFCNEYTVSAAASGGGISDNNSNNRTSMSQVVTFLESATATKVLLRP